MFRIDTDHFIKEVPAILNNELLRKPQIQAYQAVHDHFLMEKSTDHALVVLPTGTGKTGLMGIIPYGLAQSRVLIITPQLVIKDSVLGSLDPDYDKNFWLMTKVFTSRQELPSVIEYETDQSQDMLQYANIVIVNIHKLQKRLSSSLLKKVPKDFFDLIIIDEAHHAEAKTWQEAIDYFDEAKIVKVTGTPFRSDGKEIQGQTIYEYKLREAMLNGYVKQLERIKHIPDKLYLSIDKDEEAKYTIEEIRELGIKEEDWINRSVALSPESNRAIIDKSLELLEEKISVSKFPHKIIAVACSIWHAEQLKNLYEEKGYDVALVHSLLDKQTRFKEMEKIDQNNVKVVINVSMLGEGYDHKYFSVAAIFRPYKNLLPYAQFVGRVLRSIEPTIDIKEVVPDDNIAAVVYHQELGLDKLWQYYKEEIIKKEMIKKVREDVKLNPKEVEPPKDTSFGLVMESGENYLDVDLFVESELLEKRQERIQQEEEKIQTMMSMLNVDRDQAMTFIKQSQQSEDKKRLLRPDLYVKRIRKKIDKKIKLEIVPDILFEYNLDIKGTEISKITFLFKQKYKWIPQKTRENAGVLAILIENKLNDAIGGKRSEWTVGDWPRAEAELENIVSYLRSSLNHYLER